MREGGDVPVLIAAVRPAPAPADASAGACAARALPALLCYHKIESRRELGVTRLSPRRFARQIETLARDGWRTLGLDELDACVRGARPVGARDLMITFDDAYRGLRDHAFPVLAAHGFRSVCFVITRYAGRLNRWDVAYGGRRFAHLSWRDMRRWQGRGVEFASHTATHARLTWLDDGRARGELEQSRRDLLHALDVDCRAVSYPYGAARERERALARDAGFTLGFTVARPWRGDPLAVPRHPVYVWSPRRPGRGPWAPLERLAAWAANGCSVGTALIRGAA